jgi:hypothetical protein
MRILAQGAGCLVVFVGGVIAIFAIIAVFDPLIEGVARVVWGGVGVAAFGVSWFIYDRMMRRAAAETARRSEKPGERPGTRVRIYRGYAYEIAIEWFQHDATLLAPDGYSATHTRWEPLERRHLIKFIALRVLGLLTRGTNWGQFGGSLVVTYKLGATRAQALTALESCSRRLRDES